LKSREAVKASLKADSEKRHWEDKHRGLEDEIQKLRTECQELEEQYQVGTVPSGDIELRFLQTWLAKAQDYCDKFETDRSPGTIRKEIEGMERALQAREGEYVTWESSSR
jgi:hypothetical protein